MGIYPWVLTDKRKQLKDKIKETPDAGKKDFAEIVEEALEEWYKRHGSGNPYYKLDQFEREEFRAWPTAWLVWNVGFDKDLPDEEFLEMAKLIRNKSSLMDRRIKKLDWRWSWT